MFIADLHIHSTFSDGKLAIPEIVDLYGARGFGAIAITDLLCESRTVLGKAAVYMNRRLTPAVFPLYMEIIKSEAIRAWKEYRMIVIPGFEAAGVVGLGIKGFIDPMGSARSMKAAIEIQGGVALPDTMTVQSTAFQKPKHLSSWKAVMSCERDVQSILQALRTEELALTFYDEVTNDIFEFADFNDVGADDRTDRKRYRFDARTFSLAARRKRRLAHSASTRLHLKAIKGRRKRNGAKPRELL